MLDAAVEWLYVTILMVPVLIAVGTLVTKWVRNAGGGRASASPDDAGENGADVNALGFVEEGDHQRLRLRNDGDVPAKDVHVYVNNKPVTVHRGGASAQQHPIPRLKPGYTFSYRYASGGEQGAIVRIEWTDATGGGTRETVVRAA